MLHSVDRLVICICEVLRCPDATLGTWYDEMRNAKSAWEACGACHLQRGQTLYSRAVTAPWEWWSQGDLVKKTCHSSTS